MKILFEVEFDEDTIIKETLWVKPLKNGYQINNIPFYAKSVALGDVFEAIEEDGFLVPTSLLKESGNSTIRILFSKINTLKPVIEELKNNFNCAIEISDNPLLIAINIPKKSNYSAIRKYLETGLNQELWEFQEGCISTHHKKQLE